MIVRRSTGRENVWNQLQAVGRLAVTGDTEDQPWPRTFGDSTENATATDGVSFSLHNTRFCIFEPSAEERQSLNNAAGKQLIAIS